MMLSRYVHFNWPKGVKLHSADYCPDASEGWRSKWHSIPYWELVFVTGHNLPFQRGDAKLSLKQGDFLILHPHEAHRSWGDRPTDSGFYYVQFSISKDQSDGGQTTAVENGKTPAISLPIFGHTKSGEVSHKFAQLVDELQVKTDFYSLNALALFIQISVVLARQSIAFSSEVNPFNVNTPRQAEIVTEVINFLEENYRGNITAQDIRREVNLNYEYVSRVFKNVVGMTITEYTHFLRIRAARQMLVDDWKSISEVAYDLGYSTTAYFSRVFRLHEGVAPRQYIKNAYINARRG